MKFIFSLLCVIILIFFYLTFGNKMEKVTEKKILKVAFPKSWGSIIPSQQHTAYGDGVISNQFETLVQMSINGTIEPLAALSWQIQDNFKTFVFNIDNKRKFSNGESLKAMHFKKAWESGLEVEKISHNNSTLDGLYQLVGFESYEKNGHISGIEVSDDKTLILHYKESFRQALDHVSGSRFSAYIKDNNQYYGTGRYVIEEIIKNQKIALKINPFHPEKDHLNEITIEVLEGDSALNALINGKVHVYEFATNDHQKICLDNSEIIGCEFGQEAYHNTLFMNAFSGRTFNNKNFRQAFQSLIRKIIKSNELPDQYYNDSFNLGMQVYLPLQNGVLTNNEVDKIIDQGEQYIESFIQYTKKHPIYFIHAGNYSWMMDILKKYGIEFTQNSGKISWNKALEMVYKTSEMDLYMGAFSLVSGDPDGLYHALGKNGAILYPMSYKESIGKLLEEGRIINNLSELHNHYQKVSREILKEVPFVHIGFMKDSIFYRKDLVKLEHSAKDRNEHKLHFYKHL